MRDLKKKKTRKKKILKEDIYPNWVENLCPPKNLRMEVYSTFTHNCQSSEATKMPFGRWMDKETTQTTEYYLALKRNELSSHKKKLKRILLSERRESEKATYSIVPTIRYSGKDKTVKRSGGQWLPSLEGRRGWITGEQRVLGGNETIQYDIVMMDTCEYTSFQIHRVYNSRSEP